MQYADKDPDQSVGDLDVAGRSVRIPDLEAVSGSDYLVPCAPGSSESVSLWLSEKQVRELANKLGDLVEDWGFRDDDFGK